MPPKRKGVESSSNSPKKPKLAAQQPRLDSFFKRPSAKAAEPAPQVELTQEEADARFARELARSEGIDLEALRREEEAREKARRDRGIGKAEEEDDSVEIVEKPTAGPSSPPKPKTPSGTLSAPSSSKPTPSRTLAFSTPNPPTSSQPAISLDTDIFVFDARTAVDTSSWPKGRIPYSYLVSAFVLISSTRSRLAIVRILTNFLRVVIEHDPESLLACIYLTSNRLGPAHYTDNELGIGSTILTKSISSVSGLSAAALKALSNKLGDAGDIAFEATRNLRLLLPPPPLVCHSLHASLVAMARMKGQGSQAEKTERVKKLLVAARGEEARFLVRTLVQHLRIGAVRLTLTQALARAFCLTPGPGGTGEYTVSEEERGRVARAEGAQEGKKGKVKEKGDRLREEVEERIRRAEKLVRGVWARHPDYGHIVDALLAGGLSDLETRVPLAVGTPLQPMLGSITRSLQDVYDRLSDRPFVAEAKLDGQRVQLHVALEAPQDAGGAGKWYEPTDGSNGQRVWVRLFSRHLEDMTDKYPDLLPTISGLVSRSPPSQDDEPLTSFVIDAEIAAIDPVTADLRTFQELSNRTRKDVQLSDVKIRVGVFAFDLMLLNGKSLLTEPFRRRRELLRSRFPLLRPEDPRCAKWDLVPSCEDCAPEKVKAFFEQSVEMKAEGIMVKLLDEVEVDENEEDEGEESTNDSPTKSKGKRRRKVLPASYEPDRRADSWLKVKKDYLSDLGDSLDLVPIGAWHGSGRKAGWYSPILLGVYDEEAGGWTAVCKIISGFTDQFYKDLNVRYAPDSGKTAKQPFPYVEGAGLKPDFWFEPCEVWEIRGADFTLSPVYPAASGLVSERGISVRFPRFLSIREDKGPEDATTAEELADLYRKQGAPAADGSRTPRFVEEEEV